MADGKDQKFWADGQPFELLSSPATSTGGEQKFWVNGEPFSLLAKVDVSTYQQTQAGKAKVTSQVLKTISGNSRILVNVVETISGQSLITAKEIANLEGLSRITKTGTSGLSGLSRLQKLVSQTQQGVSNIHVEEIQLQTFSKEASVALPSDFTILSSEYTTEEYEKAELLDEDYVKIIGKDYLIHQFKNYTASTASPLTVSWTGRSNKSCASSTCYLQAYNHHTEQWDTLTSNNTASANTAFTLSYTIPENSSHYFDSNFISVRVWQYIS